MSNIKSLTSPGLFLIGKGLFTQIGDHCHQFGKRPLVLCDSFIRERFEREAHASLVKHNLEPQYVVFGGECSTSEINRQVAKYQELGCDFVIGVGGGKTIDTAKAVNHHYQVPVVIVPTLASTDAPCTALSVLYTDEGEFEKYIFYPRNPDAVICDTQVLVEAPAPFFAAGVADAIATWFEGRTAFETQGVNLKGLRPSLASYGIAKQCWETLVEYTEQAMVAVRTKTPTLAFEKVVEATVWMSGVGAESAGLATAHALHNGMTAVPSLHRAMHGEKVAFALIVQLLMEAKPQHELDQVLKLYDLVGLPLTLEDLGCKEFVAEQWQEVAKIACDPAETIHNEPYKVTPELLYDGILAANTYLQQHKDRRNKG